MMKIFICIIGALFILGCVPSSSQIVNEKLEKQFLEIVFTYIKKYPKINNPCKAKTRYRICFTQKDSTNGFWIASFLGKPGPVIPQEPNSPIDHNPIEIKGCYNIGDKTIVIYDYKKSDGYGIYDTSKVSHKYLEKIKDIEKFCVNVLYPEAWYFTISKDSIYKTDTREPFKLK